MKIKCFIIFIILIIFSILSCKEKNQYKGLDFKNYFESDFKKAIVTDDSLTVIKMPPSHRYDEPLSIAKLLDTCYVIPLQFSGHNLIAQVDKVKIFDDYVFILDSRRSKGVFVFKNDGSYIRRIGDIGNGPGEYPYPEDFDIDEKNKEILIFNGRIRKILRYNYNGDFLGEISIELGCYNFCLLKDDKILLFSGDYENDHLGELRNKIFYIINKKGEILSYGPNVNSSFNNIKISIGANALPQNNKISYSYKFSDTIYSFDDNRVSADYVLDFGNDKFDKEKLKLMDTQEFINEFEREGKTIANFRGSHFQTNDYIYLSFLYGTRVINCYYHKKTSRLFASSMIDFSNISCLYSFEAKGSYGDYFISILDAFNITESLENISKIKDDKWLEKNKQTIQMMSDMKINKTDNPVLIFYKLKKP